MVSRGAVILLLIVFLVSCASPVSAPLTPGPVTEDTSLPATAFLSPLPPTEAPPMPGVTADQVRNAKYQLGFTDALRIVQLTDGSFVEGVPSDTSYVEVRMTDFIALGDIDGDGVNEAAALVSENYGGTGVFVFLALFVERNEAPEFVTSVFVDDRPMIEGVSFEDGEIFLATITHSADDPFCCPTLRNERHYRLIGNQLDLSDYMTYTPGGDPRTITIESPVDGTEVLNTVQIKGNVTIAPFENNLVYRIYDVGGVELAIGAINVNAPDLGAPGTFDTSISLGNILSGAIIRIEVQDLSAADGSLFAMDSVELVVK